MTKEQAMIALRQLTGSQNPLNRLNAMIGTIGCSVANNGVSFRFKMCPKANVCRIELDEGLDLYNMVFSKMRFKNGILDCKEVKRIDALYCDQLKEIFERETKLYLSL